MDSTPTSVTGSKSEVLEGLYEQVEELKGRVQAFRAREHQDDLSETTLEAYSRLIRAIEALEEKIALVNGLPNSSVVSVSLPRNH